MLQGRVVTLLNRQEGIVMGILSAFILGCLVTFWWKAKAKQQESCRRVETVMTEDKSYLDTARKGVTSAIQKVAQIRAARIAKKPVMDDELKEILLEYAIDQVRKGKIKIVEDVE